MPKVLRIFPLVLIWILSLLLSANARQDGGRDEKNPDKKERQKITVNHEKGCVEGLQYKFKEPPQELPRGQAAAIDAMVEAFDFSLYEELSEINVSDGFGYPPSCEYLVPERRVKEEERENQPKRWTIKSDGGGPKSMPDPFMDCKPTPDAQGYFTAYFDEVDQQSQTGFDDPVYGQTRRETACQVLKDVASLVNMQQAKVTINFKKNMGLPADALALASTDYPAVVGFQGGNCRQLILTGASGIGGHIDTNFYGNIIWRNSPMDPWPPEPAYDLYTVLDHEMMHILGFASLLPSGIIGQHVSGTAFLGAHPYSLFDSFLYANANISTGLLNPTVSHFLNNVYTGDMGNSSPQTVSDEVVFKGMPTVAASGIYPVYSPDGWADGNINDGWKSGSSLSHFDEARAPSGTEYLMQYDLLWNTEKSIHDYEKEVLCRLGYNLNGFSCANNPPEPVDDVNLTLNQTQMGQEFCLNFIDNDFDPEGDDFWLNSMEVWDGGNAGSLTYWNEDQTQQLPMNDPSVSVVCYTPVNFYGIAWLAYTLTDGNAVSYNKGKIKINVLTNTCLEDPDNYVCNGGFEQASEETDVLVQAGAPSAVTQLSASCPTNIPGWCDIGTADVLRRDCQSNQPFFYSFAIQGPETHNGSPNDRYLGFLNTLSNGNLFYEGAVAKLVKPLDPNKTYELSFYFYRNVGSSGASGSNFPMLTPGVFLSDLPAQDWGNSPPGNQVDIGTPIYSNASLPGSEWAYISKEFSPSSAFQYLIIVPKRQDGFDMTGAFYSAIDDVAIREISAPQSDIAVKKFANVSQANAGDPVVYTISVSNNGATAHNLVVSDPLPSGLDFVSFTLSGPAASFDPASGELTIPVLDPGETVTLTLNVKPDWTTCKTLITNTASLLSMTEEDSDLSNNTSQASFLVADCSTVDIEIKKDVRFIKNFPGYQHVTYGIQAKNLGPAAAHAVVIVDKIPNNAVYVSHQAPAGTTASYNAVTKTVTWKIFELGVNQTKHLKLIVKRLLNQPLTNTAKLKSVLEEDTNPSNNSSTNILP